MAPKPMLVIGQSFGAFSEKIQNKAYRPMSTDSGTTNMATTNFPPTAGCVGFSVGISRLRHRSSGQFYASAQKHLIAAAKRGGVEIDVKKRECSDACKCGELYKLNWATLKNMFEG